MTKQILTSVQQVASGKTPLVLVGQEQELVHPVLFFQALSIRYTQAIEK